MKVEISVQERLSQFAVMLDYRDVEAELGNRFDTEEEATDYMEQLTDAEISEIVADIDQDYERVAR